MLAKVGVTQGYIRIKSDKGLDWDGFEFDLYLKVTTAEKRVDEVHWKVSCSKNFQVCHLADHKSKLESISYRPKTATNDNDRHQQYLTTIE